MPVYGIHSEIFWVITYKLYASKTSVGITDSPVIE